MLCQYMPETYALGQGSGMDLVGWASGHILSSHRMFACLSRDLCSRIRKLNRFHKRSERVIIAFVVSYHCTWCLITGTKKERRKSDAAPSGWTCTLKVFCFLSEYSWEGFLNGNAYSDVLCKSIVASPNALSTWHQLKTVPAGRDSIIRSEFTSMMHITWGWLSSRIMEVRARRILARTLGFPWRGHICRMSRIWCGVLRLKYGNSC